MAIDHISVFPSPPPSPSTDCPQVQAVFDYKAQQPDELDLQRGDVVKVYRKMADGEEILKSTPPVIYI
ncbi:MAG: SH3 domain-containing protein [Proteobacteria bacterium]|nr:SH3 domain-containing protein [Pseudomonadota bacterium]